MHRSFVLAVFLGVVALNGCSGKKEDVEEKENKSDLFRAEKPNDLDLSYIPQDAILVAVINPQRMLKAPMFAKLKEKELKGLMGEEFKFDVRQVKQIVVYAGMPNTIDPSDGAPGGAIIRFADSQDPAQLAEHMLGKTEQQQVEGVSTYEDAEGKAALAVIDEKTILAASPDQISKMLKARQANGPLADKLRTVPVDNDVVGVFVMNESLRSMAGMMLRMVPQGGAPAEFKDLAKVPNNLDSATFIVDLSREQFLSVAVEMKDGTSASALQKMADKGIELVKSQLAVNLKRMSLGASEDFMVVEKKNTRISQQMMDSITVTQEENLVIATADMPDEMDETMVRAVIAARKAADLMKRKNELKQIGLGLWNHQDAFKILPPSRGLDGKAFDKSGKPYLSWRVHILPFIEEQALYDQFHLDEPWDSEHNKPLLSKIPEVYKSKTDDPTLTQMLMVSGKGLAYEGGEGRHMDSFSDGIANTVIVVEAGADKAVPWTKPVDLVIHPEVSVEALGQTDEVGFLALRAEGSVFTIPKNIDAKELWALFTRAGGDN